MVEMSSRVETLNVETIETIASKLDVASLFAVRLASKELSRKTFHIFAVSCFTAISTDLSPEGLQRIKGISGVDSLRSHVRRLVIQQQRKVRTAAVNSRHFDDDNLENPSAWHRQDSGHLEPNLVLLETLKASFSGGLENCQAFQIEVCDDLGWNAGYNERGRHHPSSTDAVGMVFLIIALTGQPIIELTINGTQQYQNRLDAERIPSFLFDQPKFKQGWNNIQTLNLHHSIKEEDIEWCMALISNAQLLQTLSIGFMALSSMPFMDRLTSEHELPGLQDLAMSNIYAPTLSQIIKLPQDAQMNLERLSLCSVTLRPGHYWSATLSGLRDCGFPRLKYVHLCYLREMKLKNDSGDVRIIFDALLDSPVMPGPEGAGPRSDFRLVQPSGLSVRLIHKNHSASDNVVGVQYTGDDMETFWSVVIESAERLRLESMMVSSQAFWT